MRQKIVALMLLVLISIMIGCSPTGESGRDQVIKISEKEPAFTPLTDSWAIDNVGVVSKNTLNHADEIFERLKAEGIAEVMLIIQDGVRDPEEWTVKFGRFNKLGKKGPSSRGGNNGFVWLIRPDGDKKMTGAPGEGLAEVTAIDYSDIMDKARDYINFGNYDKGVITIAEETDKMLRRLYGKK